MIVAAVDSAELSGLAVVARSADAGERLLMHDTAVIKTAADVTATVARLADWRPDIVAIEEPFAHRRSPIAGMTLARLLGRWLQAFELAGLGTVSIPASMWQTGTLPGFTPRMKSPQRKAAAVALVRNLFGVDVGPDEADAIGLALFTLRHGRVEVELRS